MVMELLAATAEENIDRGTSKPEAASEACSNDIEDGVPVFRLDLSRSWNFEGYFASSMTSTSPEVLGEACDVDTMLTTAARSTMAPEASGDVADIMETTRADASDNATLECEGETPSTQVATAAELNDEVNVAPVSAPFLSSALGSLALWRARIVRGIDAAEEAPPMRESPLPRIPV